MKYVDIRKDFVERTLSNIEYMDAHPVPSYEVTNLVNLCLGLIVYPKENKYYIFNSFVEVNLKDPKWRYGYLRRCKQYRGETKSGAFVRHMRNAIAHGHFFQSDSDVDQITGFRFVDFGFGVEMSVDQLKNFAIDVAKYYIENFSRTSALSSGCRMKENRWCYPNLCNAVRLLHRHKRVSDKKLHYGIHS